MSDSTRRGFLKVAGTGAAVVAGAAVAPAAANAETKHADATLPSTAQAMVAHVTDVHRGQVALMIEGHEVTVTDHALVAQLANAYHRAAKNAAKAANSRSV